MRITYAARRTWPAVGGVESHLRFMTAALPAVGRVQILTSRIDNGWPHYTDVLARRPFAPRVSGQVTTEPLRVGALRRLRLLPVAAQPHVAWAPRGREWLGRRAFGAFAAGVGPAIARAADRPDVLHVFSGGNLAAAGVDAAHRLGVPLVLTPSAHPGQWDDDPLSGRAYRAADLVMAWGEADAQTYRGLGVCEERLRISPPCSAELRTGGGARIRATHGVHGPLIVFVGRRQEYKGVDLLLDSASRLGVRVPGLTLALVGVGEPVSSDAGAVRVLDVGHVGDDDKAAWLDAADVLCLPSAHESFGLAVAEAWSVGVPVVTSDIPPLRTLVEAGGGGLAVPRDAEWLGLALGDLLLNSERAGRMGESGLRFWREHLSPEAAARRTLEAYAKVCSRRRPGATWSG